MSRVWWRRSFRQRQGSTTNLGRLAIVWLPLITLLALSFLLNLALLFRISEQSIASTTAMGISQGLPRSSKVYELSADRKNCNVTATIPLNLFVPIFILTRDRVHDLQQTIESYQRTLTSPYEIIILDHNSTYPPMLEFLQELQNKKVTVHRLTEPVWDDALAHADRIMQEYLTKHTHVQYYVLTDPDVALLRTQGDILLFFAALLAACPDVNVVGPHLQISDIPRHYNGTYEEKSAFDWESQYWKNTVPYMATWNGVGYHFAEQIIDTTFACRRRTQRFARITCGETFSQCLRTYAPYAAVHLDWYLDSSHLPPDKQYYLQKSWGGVNNW